MAGTPPPATDGDGDAMNGDGDAMNGDGDAKTPAETLADARDALTALPADATDEAKEMAQMLVDVALRLPCNEAELITSLDAKVAQAEVRQSTLDLTENERQANAVMLQNAEDALASASAEAKEAAQAAVDEALQLPGNEAALIASLQRQITDQAQTIKDADAAEAAKKDSAMAKAVLTAIGDNTNLLQDQPGAPTVILAASSACVLTAELEGYTMSAAPEEIVGWRGRTLENDDGDTTVIYTNIDDAVAKEIGNIYKSSAPAGEPARYSVLVYVTVVGQEIPWSVTKRDDSITTDTGAGDDVVKTFAGNVRGLAGTFTCMGTGCTAPSEGVDAAGVWMFVPTDPLGTIDDADTAYLSFGWWLNAMGSTGAYEFDAFASATGMIPRTVEAAVEGSATYKGAAAGKYAMQSTSDDSASGGHFTAAATLTANFDANTDTTGENPNESGVSIGGAITDFMTGDVSRPNWKVTLTGPAMVPENIPVGGVEGTTSWTTGGAVPGTGEWSAVFYGGMADDQPAAATGEFEAAIPVTGEIARISGAFGATKQ